MSISFDRKMLNKNNLLIDDPHDKHLATPAQIKKTAKRGKKTLKVFWKREIRNEVANCKETI